MELKWASANLREYKMVSGLEASRAAMLWGADQDKELLAYYRDLIGKRRATTG